MHSRIERKKLVNAAALFTNARNLGFPAGSFDRIICGFMGWYDCFDFTHNEFTQPEAKAREIWRVLKDEGQFTCCSWEEQEDLRWMEEAILRYYPAILEDPEYLQERPIGMAYEKAAGYEIILHSAGFRDIGVTKEAAGFVSTDEEEWWRQMRFVGWDSLIEKIDRKGDGSLQRIKEAIFAGLQQFKRVCFI
jgi:ubiquinone/menaquinone biosynthesis C-methylase UbiE